MSSARHVVTRCLSLLVLWALLAVMHFWLARFLAGGAAVSSMLSAGAHTPLGSFALAATFYALRLTVLVIAPTCLVGFVGHVLITTSIERTAS